jgi:hypothetical protein
MLATELSGAAWRKSTYSGGNSGGQECVEIAELRGAEWQKSSYSGGNSGGQECVEVAGLEAVAAVRDSKDPEGPALVFAADAWAAFVAEVKGGRIG